VVHESCETAGSRDVLKVRRKRGGKGGEVQRGEAGGYGCAGVSGEGLCEGRFEDGV
jgi:hypothetical protein